MQDPLVQVENPAPSPEANPQYTVPVKVEARVALVGAMLIICPIAGAAVVRVRAGCPGMAGADPLGHEAKKAREGTSVHRFRGFQKSTHGSQG
jgi:hypothetical protein